MTPPPPVLLVGEARENRKVIRATVRLAGHRVENASRGQEALEVPRTSWTSPCLASRATRPSAACGRPLRPRTFPSSPLAARASTDETVQGLTVGSVDEVREPFRPTEPLVRARNHIVLEGIQQVIAQLQEALNGARRKEDGAPLSLDELLRSPRVVSGAPREAHVAPWAA